MVDRQNIPLAVSCAQLRRIIAALLMPAATFRYFFRLLVSHLGKCPCELFNLRLELFVFLVQDMAELRRLSKLLLRFFELLNELLALL